MLGRKLTFTIGAFIVAVTAINTVNAQQTTIPGFKVSNDTTEQWQNLVSLASDYLLRPITSNEEAKAIKSNLEKLSYRETHQFLQISSAIQSLGFPNENVEQASLVRIPLERQYEIAKLIGSSLDLSNTETQNYLPKSFSEWRLEEQQLFVELRKEFIAIAFGKTWHNKYASDLQWQVALLKVAEDKGVSFFNLEVNDESVQEDARKVLASSQTSIDSTTVLCFPGWVPCSTTNLWNGNTRRGNCLNDPNCVYANNNDRVSNEVCEFIGCDYRLFFPTHLGTYNGIAGITSAGECVASNTAGGSRYYSDPNVVTAHGYNSVAVCAVDSGSYLQSIMKLAP